MEQLPYQQYNTSLKDYGRKNRRQRNMTKAEWTFWNLVLKGDKTGYRFLRQKIIRSFILDFYCSKLRLGIEIDGKSHDGRQEYDEIRTDMLSERGIVVIRYSNKDVQENIDGVILNLGRRIRERKVFLGLI